MPVFSCGFACDFDAACSFRTHRKYPRDGSSAAGLRAGYQQGDTVQSGAGSCPCRTAMVADWDSADGLVKPDDSVQGQVR